MSVTQLWIYDITIKSAGNTHLAIVAAFNQIAKKWVFQEEAGEDTGYRHYQCRLNLLKKLRPSTLATTLLSHDITGSHISPTSNAAKSGFSYVMKDDTRVAGPWRDDDIQLPAHLTIVEESKFDWEAQVELLPYDMRKVHFICDTSGCMGKSTWSLYRHIQHKSAYITAWDEPIQVFQALYSAVKDAKPFSRHEIILDLPRNRLSDNKLSQLWTILEGIKNGYVQEYRYQHRCVYLGNTRLIVFSNYPLEPGSKLTRDRAKHYTLAFDQLIEE